MIKTTVHLESVFSLIYTHTHTHPFNGPLSRTTRVSQYQKGKSNLDFTEARDSEWHWHQLGHMQVCISLQTDNHASTPPLMFFYRLDALPAAQPTASKHWRYNIHTMKTNSQSTKKRPELIVSFCTLQDSTGHIDVAIAASQPTVST